MMRRVRVVDDEGLKREGGPDEWVWRCKGLAMGKRYSLTARVLGDGWLVGVVRGRVVDTLG